MMILPTLAAVVALGATPPLAGAAAGWSSPLPQDPAPVFRAGADVVTVEASVRRERRPVTGLTASDFELLDNGVPQQITDVSYEKLPIDVTVLLDVSASVTGSTLDELRRALRQLRADLGAQDRVRLLTFNMRVRQLVDFTNSAAAIDAALVSLSGAGSSAIFDSLAVALTTPFPRGRRQLILLFSDGQDSSSISDADILLDVAGRSTPTVGVVLASPSRQRPASLLRTASKLGSATVGELVDRIASDTGGLVVGIEPGANLTSTFRRVLEQFRTSYVLYFTPGGVDHQGTHTLEVRVKRPGTEVRARRGYVWR
jgi:VWFA-related protein